MGCARHSGAPVRIRLRASFYTALVVTAALIVACCLLELKALGGSAPAGDSSASRRLFYPSDLILTKPYGEDPNRWLIIFHCIGIGYMLLGLNTVCDVYFTGSLDVMVNQWNIKPDVAGATFMAAGGSAPEFFTSLVGTTWFISDVGFGTIVGSAVFNVLFVIGLCGFVAKGEIKLTWWPLFRDCSYYIMSLSVLAFFASDREIGLLEAVVLFLCYIVYCIIMYYNSRIEELVDSKVRKAKKQVAPEDAIGSHCLGAAQSARTVLPVQETESGASTTDASTPIVITACPSTFGKMDEDSSDIAAGRNHSVETSTNSTSLHPASHSTNDPGGTSMATMGTIDTGLDASIAATGKPSELSSIGDTAVNSGEAGFNKVSTASATSTSTIVVLSSISDTPNDRETGEAGSATQRQQDTGEEPQLEQSGAEEFKSKEGSDDEDGHFMDWPEGRLNQCIWLLSLPVYVPVYFLLPWPREERHMFVLTFAASLFWIAGFAFLLAWWVHTLGQVLRIKDVIMNFTLLAMGTSIPDAVSSVAVARMGEGDMAVSSSIGSNVFDILVGLPVPWIIKILIEGGNYKVRIFSEYLTFYTLLLLGMVFSVIVSIHLLGWKLNKALGSAMALLYLVFLAIAIYVELETPSVLSW